MHAIIRTGNGNCYVSAVFGVYNDTQNQSAKSGQGEYKRMLDDLGLAVEDFSNGYCWLKAKRMLYSVIPD